MKFFRRVIDIWQVPSNESGQLLTPAPGTNLDDLDPAGLNEEQMLRISSLIGVYKALHILFSD